MEAWGGGRDFVPHPTIDQLTANPTMMDDKIALPALRLMLGDYNGADFKRTNTLEKACRRTSLHTRIYVEAAQLFDAVVAAQLARTPPGTALLETIGRLHDINDQYKGRLLGSIIRDMAGREGGFTPMLTHRGEYTNCMASRRKGTRRRTGEARGGMGMTIGTRTSAPSNRL